MGEFGKSPGRPPSMNDGRITVRLPQVVIDEYQLTADVLGLSFAEFLRGMLIGGMPQLKQMRGSLEALKRGDVIAGVGVQRKLIGEALEKSDRLLEAPLTEAQQVKWQREVSSTKRVRKHFRKEEQAAMVAYLGDVKP